MPLADDFPLTDVRSSPTRPEQIEAGPSTLQLSSTNEENTKSQVIAITSIAMKMKILSQHHQYIGADIACLSAMDHQETTPQLQ